MNKQSKQIKKLTKRIKQLEKEFNNDLEVVYENMSTYDKHLENRLRKDLVDLTDKINNRIDSVVKWVNRSIDGANAWITKFEEHMSDADGFFSKL